uniref:1-aminocyclopropane-1-carboxylate synthase-like protein 1-like n=1 Tax=Saccoglossus kowalevskii TaxID=10224 RepID=A0ABM0MHU5_SACKO|nr:PREDICTED: 1-aminocyclopropane-1-carboxylate synthase-like protein 1-like [Saccoglossus kowalevskii]
MVLVNGVINAGTAENSLSLDIVAEKLSSIPSPFIDNLDILKYNDFTGIEAFRVTLAEFLTTHANSSSPLDPNKLVVMNGLTSMVCALATVLSDVGDAWLIPTPYYSAIRADVSKIPQVNLVYAHLPAASVCTLSIQFFYVQYGRLVVIPHVNASINDTRHKVLVKVEGGAVNSSMMRLACELHHDAERVVPGCNLPPAETVQGCLSEAECQPFQLNVDILETSLAKAKTQGYNVRCLFLINPHNPLGDVYSKELVLQCLQFAKRNNLHVIMDEIYMLSIFQDDVKFTSVFSLDTLPDPQRTHVIWGFSKDFSMSGMRCGAVYTWNDRVLIALKQISPFFGMPTFSQCYLNEMIKDKDWVEKTYLPTNLQRLRKAHKNMSDGLTKIGVPHLVRPSGLFIWADFSKYITPSTFDGEMELFYEILDNKVYVAPGQDFFCCQPGWFRIIFSIDEDKQEVSLKRLSVVLKKRMSSLNSE